MAKRRRLNKRVAFLLVVVGAVATIALVVLVLATRKKDPEMYARRGAAHLDKGDYREAAEAYAVAVTACRQTDPKMPQYLLALGDVLLSWQRNDPRLGPSERVDKFFEARRYFQKALHYDPELVEAHRRLLDMAGVMRDTEEVIAAAASLLALTPEDHKIRFRWNWARASLVPSKPETFEPVLKEFRKLVNLAPKEEDYWLALAGFLRTHDREKQAEQVYKEALVENPGSGRIRVNYAYLLQRLDRRDEALPILAEVIRLQPEEADGYLALATYHLRDGKTDLATQALNNAIKKDPVDFRAYASLARIRASKRAFGKAEAVLKKGLEALRKFAGEDPAALEGATLAKYRQGVIHLNQQLCDVWLDDLERRKLEGKEKVLKAVNQSLENMRQVNKRSPFVQKVLGRLALVEERYLDAERHLRIAYEATVDPRTAELLVYLYRRMGQPGDAEKIMHRFMAGSKDDALGLATLARLYVESRQYAVALDCIKDSLELEPKDAAAQALRAALEIATGQSDRVPADLEELTPQGEALILERARQLWEEGEPGKAVQLGVDVLTKRPNSLSALSHLIRWYRELDRPDDAQELYQRAQKALAHDRNALRSLAMMVETNRRKLQEMRLAWAREEKDPLSRHLRIALIYKGWNEEKYVEHLRKAEEINPDHDGVIQEMFYYHVATGDLKSAEKYLTAAAAKNLDGAGGGFLRAQLAYARKEWEEAIRLAREALRRRPAFADAYVLLGDSYWAMNMKNHEQAKQEYQRALEHNRSNYRALLGLITISRATGRMGEYNQYVEAAYRQNPRHPLIREMHLQILERQKRIEPKKLIRIREAILRDNPRDGANMVRLARLYEQDNQLAPAESIYRRLGGRRGATHADVWQLVMFLGRTDRDQEARGILAKYVADAKDKVGAYLLWSDYLKAAGEMEQAEAAGLKAIQADPKNPQAYLSMGKFYSERGNWAKAAELQKKYLAAAGDEAVPGAEAVLIRYLLEGGRTAEGADRIQKALASNPRNADMLTFKGRLMFKQNKFSEAQKLFDEALTVDGQHVQALLYRADLHVARGQARQAEADLEQARRIAPTRAIVFRLAELYDRQRDFVRAHAVIQNFLSDRPDEVSLQRKIVMLCMAYERWDQMRRDVQAAQKILPREAFFYKREAEMWLSQEKKDPRKAMLALQKASRLAPRDTETTLLMMQAMLLAGRPDDATKLGEGLRTHKAARAEALALLAQASLSRGQSAAAEKDFFAALKEAKGGAQLNFVARQIARSYATDKGAAKLAGWASARPGDWELAYYTGMAYYANGDLKNAVKFYERARARTSEDYQREAVLRELGMVYDQLGQYKQGLAAYRAVLKTQPNDGRTLNNLAWMLAKDPAGLEEAARCAKKAAELLPNSAEVLDTYGTVLLAKKQYHQAKEVLRRSTDKEKIPANLLHYGMALEKLGAKEEAYGQYRQGWDMVKKDPRNPYHKDLKAGYERLGGAPAGRPTP